MFKNWINLILLINIVYILVEFVHMFNSINLILFVICLLTFSTIFMLLSNSYNNFYYKNIYKYMFKNIYILSIIKKTYNNIILNSKDVKYLSKYIDYVLNYTIIINVLSKILFKWLKFYILFNLIKFKSNFVFEIVSILKVFNPVINWKLFYYLLHCKRNYYGT